MVFLLLFSSPHLGLTSFAQDELLWAALWLYEATSESYYLNYAIQNAHGLGGTGWAMTEFSWDVKYAGLQVLATKVCMYMMFIQAQRYDYTESYRAVNNENA